MRRKQGFVAAQLLISCLLARAGEVDAPRAPVFSATEQEIIATLAPRRLPPPPPDKTNRFADDPVAAEFGRKLFFDPRFSGRLLEGDNDGSINTLGKKGETGRVSCAGCHVPQSGFLDSRSLGHSISLAAGWGRRHAPSLNDVGQVRLLMWDGRRDSLYNQIFEVIESHVEMNSSRLFVAQQLSRFYRKEYERIFGNLPDFNDPREYPQLQADETGCRPAGPSPRSACDGVVRGIPGDRGDFDGLSAEKQEAVTRAVANMGKALASYERKLSCGQGRFDAWSNGQKDALSDAEQRGLKLFVGKGKCVQCHSGPYFSDQKFHNVGLVPQTVAIAFRDVIDDGAYGGIGAAMKDPLNSRGKFSDGDDGRLPQVPAEELKGAYKTPMLRCVNQRLGFMHTGQITDLGAVIEFFNQGGSPMRLIGRNELTPLGLSASEKADLLMFLKTLDGPGSAQELLSP
ncbi:MAG: cytochrome c peroxidase [Pseudomonadota bacterium]